MRCVLIRMALRQIASLSKSVLRLGQKPSQNTSSELVVVSLTTIPPRSSQLDMIVKVLLQQTIIPDIILVNIPKVSRRFPKDKYDFSSIESYPEICLNWIDHDYGPSTKLIPAVEWLLMNLHGSEKKSSWDPLLSKKGEKAFLITVDDDTIYHPHMVENMLYYARLQPDAVLCNIGCKQLRRKIFAQYSPVDVVMGYGGVLYPFSIFQKHPHLLKRLKVLGKQSRELFTNDDIVISKVLEEFSCDRYCIPNHFNEKEPLSASLLYSNPLWKLNQGNQNYYRCLVQSQWLPEGQPGRQSDSFPKKIHFVWIGPKKIPEKFQKNIELWKIMHPFHQVILWQDHELNQLVQKKMPEYYSFYMNLELILRVDFGKLILCYFKGGLALDMDFVPNESIAWLWETYHDNHGVFLKTPNFTNAVCIGFLLCRPYLMFFLKVIHSFVERGASRNPIRLLHHGKVHHHSSINLNQHLKKLDRLYRFAYLNHRFFYNTDNIVSNNKSFQYLTNLNYHSWNGLDSFLINKVTQLVCVPQSLWNITNNLMGNRRLFSDQKIISYYGFAQEKIRHLMVVAHPDDETLFGGELLMQDVGSWLIICVTGGSNKSTNRFRIGSSRSTYCQQRQMEFFSACKAHQAAFELWNHEDNLFSCQWENCILTQQLHQVLERHPQLDSIATHNAHGEYGHPQHQAVHKLVKKVIQEKHLENKLVLFREHRVQHIKQIPKINKILQMYSSQKRKIAKITKGGSRN